MLVHLTNEQRSVLAERFRLSPRELDLVAALLGGATDNARLAAAMGVGVGTVKGALHVIFAKTGTRDKTHLLLAIVTVLQDHARA